MSKKLRRTKIVATLGPATDNDDNLEKIILAGANIVRMNFSHGTSRDHEIRAEKVRKIAKRLGYHIAILGDLQGPKIRISTFKEGKVFLNVGDKFLLDTSLNKGEGNKEKVGVDYKDLPKDVRSGDLLLIDDGYIQLKVLEVQKTKIFTTVIVGGLLSNNKGINKFGGGLSAKSLTNKDLVDIVTAASIGVDYLAISFPQCGKDLKYARNLALNYNCSAKIVAKIERAEAVCNQESIDDIILASDVVMIARGDLGIEIGNSKLIGIQKALIRRSLQLNRAVITATQMMESMIDNPMPTRAEVMDIANAVLDGTDATMLSAETAIGRYPSEAVATMANICLGAEKVLSSEISKQNLNININNIEEAFATSVMYIANHLKGVTAIIIIAKSEQIALITSRINSSLPIFALSNCEQILSFLALYRGVNPIYFNCKNSGSLIVEDAVNLLTDKGYLSSGDIAVLLQEEVIDMIESTNIIRTIKIK